MALIISPLIRVTKLSVRLTFFIWLINFLRCFAAIPEDIDAGYITPRPLDVIALLFIFAVSLVLASKTGSSLVLSFWQLSGKVGSLIIHDFRQHVKIRAAQADSLVTFEHDLADAADE